MKRTFSTYLPLVLFSSLVVALDQWTKWLVRTNIPFSGSWLPEGWGWLHPYARIVHWYNSGAAFGMFQNGNLVDRLTIGKVTDFISVGTFPVFNVADASISVGVAALLLGVWMKERAERRNSNQLSVSSDQSSVVRDQPAENETAQ